MAVPAAVSDAAENSGFLKIEKDLLHSLPGDADSVGHVAEPGGWVVERADQNMRVIGE